MKIACPQCGQHYEVEAGALDRYFRCTECQMLFRGLNAKPVKERKIRRKNKTADEKNEAASTVPENAVENNPAATTAAIAVENMEKEAVEAEARFWEKSLEEDVLAEKAVKYRKTSVNWQLIVLALGIVLLAVAFVIALVANAKVNDLIAEHKGLNGKEIAYKGRIEKLEQRLEVVQTSLQNISAADGKMKQLFDHINTKVNDQTLARKVDELSKSLEKHYKDTEELKNSISKYREDWEKFTEADKATAKQRKTRR